MVCVPRFTTREEYEKWYDDLTAWVQKQYRKDQRIMATTFELAKQYYPRLWDDKRIDALVAAGKLTEEEATAVKAAVQAPA